MSCKTIADMVGDKGQRYEVRAFSAARDGEEFIVGFTDVPDGGALSEMVIKHPTWHSPRVIDRRPPPIIRSPPLTLTWHPVAAELPAPNTFIMMKGDSGYVTYRTFYVAGYYAPEYRPKSPWLDTTSTCLEDTGWIPTEWAYIEEPK